MFSDVPECSAMFRVPGFIDARRFVVSAAGDFVYAKFSISSFLFVKDQIASFQLKPIIVFLN